MPSEPKTAKPRSVSSIGYRRLYYCWLYGGYFLTVSVLILALALDFFDLGAVPSSSNFQSSAYRLYGSHNHSIRPWVPATTDPALQLGLFHGGLTLCFVLHLLNHCKLRSRKIGCVVLVLGTGCLVFQATLGAYDRGFVARDGTGLHATKNYKKYVVRLDTLERTAAGASFSFLRKEKDAPAAVLSEDLSIEDESSVNLVRAEDVFRAIREKTDQVLEQAGREQAIGSADDDVGSIGGQSALREIFYVRGRENPARESERRGLLGGAAGAAGEDHGNSYFDDGSYSAAFGYGSGLLVVSSGAAVQGGSSDWNHDGLAELHDKSHLQLQPLEEGPSPCPGTINQGRVVQSRSGNKIHEISLRRLFRADEPEQELQHQPEEPATSSTRANDNESAARKTTRRGEDEVDLPTPDHENSSDALTLAAVTRTSGGSRKRPGRRLRTAMLEVDEDILSTTRQQFTPSEIQRGLDEALAVHEAAMVTRSLPLLVVQFACVMYLLFRVYRGMRKMEAEGGVLEDGGGGEVEEEVEVDENSSRWIQGGIMNAQGGKKSPPLLVSQKCMLFESGLCCLLSCSSAAWAFGFIWRHSGTLPDPVMSTNRDPIVGKVLSQALLDGATAVLLTTLFLAQRCCGRCGRGKRGGGSRCLFVFSAFVLLAVLVLLGFAAADVPRLVVDLGGRADPAPAAGEGNAARTAPAPPAIASYAMRLRLLPHSGQAREAIAAATGSTVLGAGSRQDNDLQGPAPPREDPPDHAPNLPQRFRAALAKLSLRLEQWLNSGGSRESRSGSRTSTSSSTVRPYNFDGAFFPGETSFHFLLHGGKILLHAYLLILFFVTNRSDFISQSKRMREWDYPEVVEGQGEDEEDLFGRGIVPPRRRSIFSDGELSGAALSSTTSQQTSISGSEAEDRRRASRIQGTRKLKLQLSGPLNPRGAAEPRGGPGVVEGGVDVEVEGEQNGDDLMATTRPLLTPRPSANVDRAAADSNVGGPGLPRSESGYYTDASA